ncbi:uncharacterized protein LOC110456072 [Mizuhopecten yessoensis]|uniref:uncharacterized protein LOC110456072 n=1 Tax=Mizuhopecten yessoensis TaxID=6573 RepID=UPI000B457F5C|nr:uncharacterized protein LOC110456072 [Mizuhopecten yessoensis]
MFRSWYKPKYVVVNQLFPPCHACTGYFIVVFRRSVARIERTDAETRTENTDRGKEACLQPAIWAHTPGNGQISIRAFEWNYEAEVDRQLTGYKELLYKKNSENIFVIEGSCVLPGERRKKKDSEEDGPSFVFGYLAV